MAKIDIDKFIIDMIRLTWENKFLATCSMKALEHQALKFVDTPYGGKIIGVERLKCPCDDCPAMVPGGCALTCSKYKAYKEKLGNSPILSNSSNAGKDELTEFERYFGKLIRSYASAMGTPVVEQPKDKEIDFIKKHAPSLLSLARKQIAEEIDIKALVDSYKKIVSDFPKGATASLGKKETYETAIIDVIHRIKNG